MASNRTLKNNSLLIDKNFIGGKWVPSKSGQTFPVHDPATEELLGIFPESTAEDAQQAIDAAAAAMPEWRNLTGRERSHVLRRWFYLIQDNTDDLAALISWENGKAAADAAGEVSFAGSFLEWYSEEAARVYGDVIPHSARSFRVMVLKEPVGVCGLITPWNFPGAMITRKLGPALAAGCSVVLKPAGETPFTANALVWLAEQAGVPKGVINVVHAADNTPEIGQVLCSSNIVRKISFTGSTRVGRLLMKQSGDTVKKLSLELGGNAPVIVFDDANLDVAIQAVIIAKFKVTGQTCVCANRIYVQSGIYEEFVRRLTIAVREFKVGDARDPTVTHGPLINSAAACRVAELVDEAVQKGAKAVAGGKNIPILGTAFYEPTILTNITNDMRVTSEEIFGPVAAIQSFDSEEQVIDAANNCDVGLASYVFTEQMNRIARVSERLESGMVAVNTGVISVASAPFGGVKQSGIGREGSKYGLDDYLVTKTVVLGNVNVQHRASI
ncbi:Aldehyde/histidinol dehydrogenase [Aspergillus caelatus]|uniref:Succinate-semialdehyde dehydrogenase, mitochondrial n=2 Tax=Aspergillus subgen. Circumdati TaxID=2720871 RepID=A0A5N7AKR0_9EURO|nr:Aldehyde/histidinol dehydrogenase [Aspergillus caelatus]KAE8370447.1 Aldehyde/histidinol dehydrogenase [Aspergillus caelatus]KAE8415604.1 Aldehyde/histidinol dehydrogenase [Aspergillus pseudocaelatus]